MAKRNATGRNQMGLLAPSLEQTQIPIESVKPHPDNDNIGDVDFIMESIQAHGMYKPIVVQASTRHICAGNHTYLACQRLGMTTIAAVELDIDDDQALAILDVDNESARRAKFDVERRRLNLKRIASKVDVEELPLFAVSVMDRLEELEGAAELPQMDSNAAHAETPEQYAARAMHEGKSPSAVVQGLKEVILMFRQEDYERFLAVCKQARADLRVDSNTAVVIRAMSQFYPTVWEHGGKSGPAAPETDAVHRYCARLSCQHADSDHHDEGSCKLCDCSQWVNREEAASAAQPGGENSPQSDTKPGPVDEPNTEPLEPADEAAEGVVADGDTAFLDDLIPEGAVLEEA